MKALENHSDDLVINKTNDGEVPLIQRYQYNKNNAANPGTSGTMHMNKKYSSRHSSGPYGRQQRRPRR